MSDLSNTHPISEDDLQNELVKAGLKFDDQDWDDVKNILERYDNFVWEEVPNFINAMSNYLNQSVNAKKDDSSDAPMNANEHDSVYEQNTETSNRYKADKFSSTLESLITEDDINDDLQDLRQAFKTEYKRRYTNAVIGMIKEVRSEVKTNFFRDNAEMVRQALRDSGNSNKQLSDGSTVIDTTAQTI